MSRKQMKNIQKKHTHYHETHTHTKHTTFSLETPPPAARAHKKVPEGAQRQSRRAKGTQKNHTRAPRTPQRIPKVPKRHPRVQPGPPKSEPKVTLGPTKKGVWKCLEIGGLNSPKVSSHASKSSILKPGLAWEREARLKEKRCRDIVKSNPNTIPNDPRTSYHV